MRTQHEFLAGALAALVAIGAQAGVCVKSGERVAFLGDSITQYGNGPCGYVNLVMKGLETVGVKADKIPAGIGGNKSNDMLARLDNDVLRYKPQWMTFSCGVNDVWHEFILGKGKGVSLPDYKKNVCAIFDKCDAAGVKVIVLTATMIGEHEDDEKNVALAPYNDFLRAEAVKRGYPLADLNKAEREGLAKLRAQDPVDRFRYTLEGVHMIFPGDCMMAWGVLRAMGVPEEKKADIERVWFKMPNAYPMGIALSSGQYAVAKAKAEASGRSVEDFVRYAAVANCERKDKPLAGNPEDKIEFPDAKIVSFPVSQDEKTKIDGQANAARLPWDRYIRGAVLAAEPTHDFHDWAVKPPMGWNSFDAYGSVVNEDEIRRNADWQAEHLLKHGYEYCVVDIRWTVQNETNTDYNEKDPVYTLDKWGRYLPAPNRFPSSANGKGFKPLADYVHSKGLKFGIHIMRGVPKEAVRRKCPVKGAPGVTCDKIGNNKTESWWLKDNCTVVKGRLGAQEYYDSIMELYAAWGVDFIKCDDIAVPYMKGEVELIRAAIDKCGRPIVLSLSPGETPLEEAGHAAGHANMWRMVGDLWDKWDAVEHLTDVASEWLKKPQVSGAWPDCDMIPLGRLAVRGYEGTKSYATERNSRLTRDEARYLMTLMAICRSPLMIGSDLPSLAKDPETLALLTDPLILGANQNASNPACRRLTKEECVIMSEAANGGRYMAFFNRTAEWRKVSFLGHDVDLPPHGAALRLW